MQCVFICPIYRPYHRILSGLSWVVEKLSQDKANVTRHCPDGCIRRGENRHHPHHTLSQLWRKERTTLGATGLSYHPSLLPFFGVWSKNFRRLYFLWPPRRSITIVTQDSTDSLSRTLESQTENTESVGNSREAFVLTFSGFLRMPASPPHTQLLTSSSISKAHTVASSKLSSHCFLFSVSLTISPSLHVSVSLTQVFSLSPIRFSDLHLQESLLLHQLA